MPTQTAGFGDAGRPPRTRQRHILSLHDLGDEQAIGSKLSDINRSQLLATRLAVRRRAVMLAANKKVLEDAKAIAKWASPTAALLSSSTDQVLTSLPQLNQNANQLKSFLPSSSN